MFLDVDSLDMCRMVCKAWRDLSSSPLLWRRLAFPALNSEPSPFVLSMDIGALRKAARLVMRQRVKQQIAKIRSDISELHHRSKKGTNVGGGQVVKANGGRFSGGVAAAEGHVTRSSPAEDRAKGWHQPPRSIQEEMDFVASEFYKELASETAASRLELLERQKEVLTQRSAHVATGCSSMLAMLKNWTTAVEDLRPTFTRQCEGIVNHISQSSVLVASAQKHRDDCDRAAANKEFCRRIVFVMERMEAVIVEVLLSNYFVDPSSPVAHNGEGNIGKKDRTAKRPILLRSFAELELLCLNSKHFGSTLSVYWSLIKRSLPVDETYFDLKDAALDGTLSEAIVTEVQTDSIGARWRTINRMWERCQGGLSQSRQLRLCRTRPPGDKARTLDHVDVELSAKDLMAMLEEVSTCDPTAAHDEEGVRLPENSVSCRVLLE